MKTPLPAEPDHERLSRRGFLCEATLAGASSLVGANVTAQNEVDTPLPQTTANLPQTAPRRDGLLFPQQNQLRNVLDTSGPVAVSARSD